MPTTDIKQGTLKCSSAKVSKQLLTNTGISQPSSNGGAAVATVIDRVLMVDTASKASTATDSTDDTATTDASDSAGDTDTAADSDANEEQASHMLYTI
jgi:hypothetical protein